ncbi:Pumilio RNA-binding repeat-containing protein [Hirschfeldia incana]|nr:Pumilio RNA-binding repeat-containing protein [Hirschfeldia incana]
MTDQNEDAHPVVPSSPYQQLRQDTIQAYETMYGSLDNHYSLGNTPFSPLSDLQILESSFGRLGVSDSNARQPQLLDHRRNNQYPLGARDRGMNVQHYHSPSYYPHPTEREQLHQEGQRLWYGKDNHYEFYKSYGSDGRTNSGVTGRPPYIGFNGDLGDLGVVPFTSSNHNLCYQSPWSFSHVPKTGTNRHDPYPMNNSRATDTILSRAKDVVESTKLQKVIVEGSRDIVDKIFEELPSHVCELMVDPVGHQIFQKLIEKSTGEQTTQILDIVIQQPIQFVRICGDAHGTRAIQDLMRSLCSEEQISRLMETCLLQVIVQNCYQIALDQHGCCMLQQCIGKSPPEIRDPLISGILTNSLGLCINRYGNYAVQYVLEMENFQVAASLSRYLDGHYVQLSCDKFGSHVVQKCLETRQFNSRRIINELISDIDSILVDRFGNYVIQTAWDVSQDDMRRQLLYHINKNYPLMRCNMYGRKILEKLRLWG